MDEEKWSVVTTEGTLRSGIDVLVTKVVGGGLVLQCSRRKYESWLMTWFRLWLRAWCQSNKTVMKKKE